MLIILFTMLSQFQPDTIDLNVLAVKPANNIYQFEDQFIRKVVTILNKRSKDVHYRLNINYTLSFKEKFNYLDTTTHVNSSFAIATISITKERQKRFDFTKPYLPNLSCYIKKSGTTFASIDSTLRVGVIKNTVNTKYAEFESKKNGFQLIHKTNTSELVKAIRKDEIDLYIGDSIESWAFKNLEVFEFVDNCPPTYFGIMLPKGSKLTDEINSILKYYIKSMHFYSIIKSHFKSNVSDQYISVLTKQK